MRHSDNYFRLYLRTLAQPVTYIGVAMLLFIYCALAYLLIADRTAAYEEARSRGNNLVHIIDKSLSNVFKSADATLLFLRKSYQQNPSTFDLSAWVRDPSVKNELTFHFAIIDANGRLVDASRSEKLIGTDYSQRAFFRAQLSSTADELIIGKPLTLESNGKRVIVLSRRMTSPDGSFAGAVATLIDISALGKQVSTIDLGHRGNIALVGTDGSIRLRVVNGKLSWQTIGLQLPSRKAVLGHVERAKSGHFWNIPTDIDNVSRLVSFRVLKSFPMIAIVAISESEVYRRADENARIYWTIVLPVTVAGLIAIGFGAARERRLIKTTSEMNQAQQSLQRTNQELIDMQYAIDQAVTVTVTDVQGNITHVNDKFCRISGYGREELLGKNHRIMNSGSHSETFFRDLYRDLTDAEVWRGEICNKAKNGSLYWVDTTIVPQLGPDGKPVAYMAIRTDITTRKQAEAHISYLASHDELTGIGNRAVLYEKMAESLVRLRQHQETFSVLLLDLDGFKHVNDTLGHAAGDKLLKELARRLESSLRGNDILTRLGGDEFAIIQNSALNQQSCISDQRDYALNQREAAIGLALRLLQIAAEPFDLDGHNVTVGTSIGITVAPEDGDDAGELLQKADLALYRAKSAGRNNFRFFDAEMSKDARARLRLLADLRAALTRDEFELHYQPIFDAKTSRPSGVEALVRWRHPVDGLMLPDSFIPLAEETGLMEPLGEWILEKACKDAASWPDSVKVAVNLSAVQFRSGKLFDIILCALVDSGLPPERLELEITETVLMQNAESNNVVLQQLKNIGISIALDDFGTGYSSLSYLTMFPFDKIKIDKSFTQGLTDSANCTAIVASVLTLARGLDMIVTAEGVETKQEFELLRTAGVHLVQGYLFGRPTPLAELDFFTLEQKGEAVEAA